MKHIGTKIINAHPMTRNQPNDQRLVMTVNVGSITPSATYNKGRVLIVVSGSVRQFGVHHLS